MAARVVELQFGRHVHPVYREQLHAVPDGWTYHSEDSALFEATTPTKLVVERGARFARARGIGERVALRIVSEAGYVHRIRSCRPTTATIIHAAERLLRDPPVPYVVDFEHASLFVLYQPAALERPWARRALADALLDKRLRFLLGWSDAACRSIAGLVPSDVAREVEPKLRTVRPAIRPATGRFRSRTDSALRLLFVGTKFYEKGAVEAVRALRLAREHHDVTMQIVSYVPSEWQAQLAAEPGLVVSAPGGADLVQRLYRESDALLFPSHMDTFGYVVLEAMAHALPVLTADHLALPELVHDGISGLLFTPENMLYDAQTRLRFRHVLPPPKHFMETLQEPSALYVASIASAIGRLASDGELYERLSRGALESVTSGALSMQHRRNTLADVYAAAAS